MKKLAVFILSFTIASAGVADIQAPPGGVFTKERKLARGLANIFYGLTELPSTISRTRNGEGRKAGMSYGVVKGIQKSAVRFGYGLYELVTFHRPTYKEGFRPMTSPHDSHHPGAEAYFEFPPELGFRSYNEYSRHQNF